MNEEILEGKTEKEEGHEKCFTKSIAGQYRSNNNNYKQK